MLVPSLKLGLEHDPFGSSDGTITVAVNPGSLLSGRVLGSSVVSGIKGSGVVGVDGKLVFNRLINFEVIVHVVAIV